MADERTPRTEAGRRLLAHEVEVGDADTCIDLTHTDDEPHVTRRSLILAIEREAALRAGAAHDEGLREALETWVRERWQVHPTDADVALYTAAKAFLGYETHALASSPEPVPSEPDAG